jgi:TPR repeat protein
MYRDGKGVEKDLGKATEWMEKAYINDPGRWGAEFDDLLSRD